jgi:hypothetical protein
MKRGRTATREGAESGPQPATVGSLGARLIGEAMATLLIFHEVDDVDHWLASPKREEFFGSLGMSVRTFVDHQTSNRVGLIVEVPDMATFEKALQSPEAAEAMKHDGVRPDTIVTLVEGKDR